MIEYGAEWRDFPTRECGHHFLGRLAPRGYGDAMNPWLVLSAAIVAEVAGTLCLKVASTAPTFADRVTPGIGVAVFYGSTLVLMAIAMKSLEVGITYTVWAGAGTALVTLAGIVLFKESFAWPKVVGIALVVAGVMVLHSLSKHQPDGDHETNGLPARQEAPEGR